MNNSPINATINYTTVGELADATSLYAIVIRNTAQFPKPNLLFTLQYPFGTNLVTVLLGVRISSIFAITPA